MLYNCLLQPTQNSTQPSSTYPTLPTQHYPPILHCSHPFVQSQFYQPQSYPFNVTHPFYPYHCSYPTVVTQFYPSSMLPIHSTHTIVVTPLLPLNSTPAQFYPPNSSHPQCAHPIPPNPPFPLHSPFSRQSVFPRCFWTADYTDATQ